MPRRPLLAALLVLLVVGTACQVRTTVAVDVADDGSGTVEAAVGLDADAMSQLPDLDRDGVADPADLAALVRVDDLLAAGWTVSEPARGHDGTTWLRVTRAFGTPAEAVEVLAGLTGPAGALRDLTVTRAASFGRTEYSFSGTADLRGGLEAFGDEGLAAALDGEPLGEDGAAIEARAGRPLADAFTFEIASRLAGEETTWEPRLGDGPVAMAAGNTVYDWPVLALVALALASLLATIAVIVRRTVRSRQGVGADRRG